MRLGQDLRISARLTQQSALAVIGAALFTVPLMLGMQGNPSFEVASVRQNKSPEGGGRIQIQSGTFSASGSTVRQLILRAYGVQDFQIVDEPGWVNSTRFDIAARMAANTTPDQVALMIRSLLVERFNLRVHTETRDLPIYALVLARKDGKLGPQIKPSNVDCDAIAEEAIARGGAPPPTPAGQEPPCSIGFSGRGRMSARSKPISALLTFFSQVTQRTVIDRTGLKGSFDLDLSWTPNIDLEPGPTGAPIAEPNGASIFTAVQEQLGLKLEAAKAPLPALVIDGISQASEN